MYEIPTPEVPTFDPAVLGQMAPFYQMMPGMLQYQVGRLERHEETDTTARPVPSSVLSLTLSQSQSSVLRLPTLPGVA